MAEHCLNLDFFGAGLSVTASEVVLLDRLAAQFDGFVAGECGSSDAFELQIVERQNPEAAPDMPMTWQGEMPDGRFGTVFETEDRAVLRVEDGVVVTVDHRKRTALALVRPGSHDMFFSSPIMFILDAALTASGQQFVHAACLMQKDTGSGVLICVPSGGGKTTTSLALCRDGFALMTDDTSVLVPGADGPKVWGLPRALKVHRKTAELLPWVGPLADAWDSNDEQAVPLASIDDRIAVMTPKPTRLAAIFLLGPRSAQGHVVSRLSKADMLVAIAHDNVPWRASGMTPKALRSFAVMAETVADVPAFLISAGEELATLPAMISEVLNTQRSTSESA
jgi:hypothetical protein